MPAEEPVAEAAPEIVAEAPAIPEGMDIDPVMAAMIAAGDMPVPTENPEAPAEIDALVEPSIEGMEDTAGVIVIEEPIPEEMAEVMPEMAEAMPEMAEAAPDMMDALVEPPAEEPSLSEAIAMDIMSEAAPTIDIPMEAEAVPTIDIPMEAEAAPEADISMDIPLEEAPSALDILPEEAEVPTIDIPMDMGEVPTIDIPMAEEEVPTIDIPVEAPAEAVQTPVELDMNAAATVMAGAVEDIEEFLGAEDYEYTKVTTESKTLVLIKTQDNNSMAIVYSDGEFESLETSYDKDGKTGYGDIMNVFVKETIKSGGCTGIKRHKGNNVVAK